MRDCKSICLRRKGVILQISLFFMACSSHGRVKFGSQQETQGPVTYTEVPNLASLNLKTVTARKIWIEDIIGEPPSAIIQFFNANRFKLEFIDEICIQSASSDTSSYVKPFLTYLKLKRILHEIQVFPLIDGGGNIRNVSPPILIKFPLVPISDIQVERDRLSLKTILQYNVLVPMFDILEIN